MVDLLPALDRNSKKSLYEQLYEYVKQCAQNGVFLKNDKMPSVRAAANSLGISKTTVVQAYDQLVLEGYLEARDRSGYFICADSQQGHILSSAEPEVEFKSNYHTYNDEVDEKTFDEKQWAGLIASVIRDKKSLLSYGEVFGEFPLRKAINNYLAGMRGVVTEPTRIIIGAGMHNLINVLKSFIPRCKIAFEYPGFEKGMKLFAREGFDCVPIPLVKDGLDMDLLYKSGARLVFVTPSHQYPTGAVMSVSTRSRLIEWARSTDSYIIEDDYDSILRFHGRPIPALQGMDPARIIHFGSFSKLIIPAMRISYMVLPKNLAKELFESENLYMQPVSRVEQLALAEFIDRGYFERHIRKIRKAYSVKNDNLTRIITADNSPRIKLIGNQSGFHILLKIDVGDISALRGMLLKKGIRIEPIAGLENIVMVYYSGVEDEKEFYLAIKECVEG